MGHQDFDTVEVGDADYDIADFQRWASVKLEIRNRGISPARAIAWANLSIRIGCYRDALEAAWELYATHPGESRYLRAVIRTEQLRVLRINREGGIA